MTLCRQYFEVGRLFDFYGELLTQKQREIIELYYQHDWTMQEIADALSITKQSVSLTLHKGVEKLYVFENQLHFSKVYDQFEGLKSTLKTVLRTSQEEDWNAMMWHDVISDLCDNLEGGDTQNV